MAAEAPQIGEDVFGVGRDVFAERSVKLTPQGVQADRVLYGIRSKDAPGLRGQVMTLARRLLLPRVALDEIELRFGEAFMVHAGQEGRDEAAVCKLYLEFATPPADLPGLRFIAWKAAQGRVVRSTYTRIPAQRPEAFAAVFGPLPPPVAQALDGLVRLAASRLDPANLVLLRLEEPGTPRASLDLNLYDAGLTLGMAQPLLAPALALFGQAGVPGFGTAARLGHLSAGIGRDGAPFLTIYADATLKRAVA
ncbi:hypothetical protein [Thetidibacter halocola]|uniref:Uncharacterized protein n=1 Tax=Thetidibacter halocola TaxID=2827239 RepID=A0A8J7WFR8_9RHOB|nr:hypothetical protein [Thetidibacter halocola]MBS0126830.1 hypothetical protein [Thetidibacter halocola]